MTLGSSLLSDFCPFPLDPASETMSQKIWHRYEPSASQPWNWTRVKHLHRRAAFGATCSELRRDVADGPDKCVSRLLNGDGVRIDGLKDDFEEIASSIGDAAASSNDANRLKAWWLFRMLFTPDPLREKLALMWHCHFATSNLKVNSLPAMYRQNQLLRDFATAKFSRLLRQIVRDPAMLIWLDANSNRAGHPNENLARELMELFTLGVGHYSERDVQEAARALTGWTNRRNRTAGPTQQFRADRHDPGDKTILGETAPFDLDSLLRLLLTRPATSQRIAWRICDLLMGEGIASKAAMDELACGLRANQLSVEWAVSTVLRSELFFSDANIASRISSPIEFTVGTVRSLEMLASPPSTLILAAWVKRLGQDLFYPPNVGGWKGGRSWLTSRRIVGRANFAAALVAGKLRAPTDPPCLDRVIDNCVPNRSSREEASNAITSLLLSSPPSETSLGYLKGTESTSELVARVLSTPDAHLT